MKSARLLLDVGTPARRNVCLVRRIAVALIACGIAAPPARAYDNDVWDGGHTESNAMSLKENWLYDTYPAPASDRGIVFKGDDRPSPYYDLTAGTSWYSWHFTYSNQNFSVGGNAFGIYLDIANEASSGRTFTINNDGIYARSSKIYFDAGTGSGGGDLIINAPVHLDNNAALSTQAGSGRKVLINSSIDGGNGSGGQGELDVNNGLLILAGSNSYDNTDIQYYGATLKVGNGGTSGTLGQGSVSNSGVLVFNRSDSVTISNDIYGEGKVVQGGSGTTKLTGSLGFSGAVEVNAGKLVVEKPMRSASGWTVEAESALELGGKAQFVSLNSSAVDSSRVLVVNGGTLAMNDTMESRIGNVTLRNGATWNSDRSTGDIDVLLADVGTGPGTTAAAVVKVENTGGSTAAATMGGAGGINLSGTQEFNIADVTGNGNADLTVNMTLSDPGAAAGDLGLSTAGGLRKTGAGTMAVNQQASYSGGTTIDEGVLDLTAAGGTAGTIRGAVTVNNNATLRLSAADATGSGTGDDRVSSITLTGGTLRIESGAQHFSNAALRMTNGTISGASGATLEFTNGSTSVETLASATASTISVPTLHISQDTTGFTVANGDAQTDLTVSSDIGNGSGDHSNNLTKDGEGAMALTGTNTYRGLTKINAGILLAGGDHALGSTEGGTEVASGATLRLASGVKIGSEALTIRGTGYNNQGALTVASGGVADFAGTITAAADATIHTNSGTLNLTGGIVKDGTTLTVSGGGTVNVSGTGLSGASSGSDLILSSNTKLNLAADSSYHGSTTIGSGAVLAVGQDKYDGATTAGTLGVGSVSNSGTLLFNRSNTLTVENAIGGTGKVTQNGSGTTKLTGTSNYTGNTLVAHGTLVVNGTLGNTRTTVSSGAMLGGTGRLNGQVTVSSGGIISGGAEGGRSIGTLSMSALSLSGIWQVDASANGVNDKLTVTSPLFTMSGGSIRFLTASGYTVQFGDTFDLADFSGGIGGYSANAFDFTSASLASGGEWDVSTFPTTGKITYIPEPGATVLGLLALLAAGTRRRR